MKATKAVDLALPVGGRKQYLAFPVKGPDRKFKAFLPSMKVCTAEVAFDDTPYY